MPIKFTDAIQEVENGGDFMAYLKEHAPGLVDTVAAELGKNFTAGDVHVPAAGGEDPKKKKKPIKDVGDRISVGYAPKDEERERTAKLLHRVLNPREKLFNPEVETFDSAGSSDAAFGWWLNQVQKGSGWWLNQVQKGSEALTEIEKLKLKHKTSLEANAGELKALIAALNDNPTLRAALQQALTVAVGKDAGTRTLRIVRHGATHLNNNDTSVDRVRGWKNVPLSEEGKEEAQKLADKMAKDPPDHMVCSDLKRAHDTAKLIAKATGVPIDEVSEEFRPWNVGKYAGVSSKEAVPILARYACEEPDTAVPGGESFNKFRSRFFNGLADASNKYPDGVLAVVTHHRGERLLSAWQAAGFPADGSMEAKEFTKKGEKTAGYEDIEIPVDKLRAAASANVTKFLNKPEGYDSIIEEDDLDKVWGSNDELPSSLDGLPDHAKTVFRQVANDRIKAGQSEVSAIRQAWTAVKNGWRKEGDGWVRKEEAADKSFSFNVLKVDAEQQIFYGWAYISEENGKILVDKQDDYIEPQDLLKAAEDFTLQGGKLGDMHDQRNVGRVVASFVTTKENCDTFGIKCDADRRGWILGFKCDDPEVWAKIKSGAQLELSIGGKGERIPSG